MAKWLAHHVMLNCGSDREIWLRDVATGRAIIVRRDTFRMENAACRAPSAEHAVAWVL
jgi:hypothetical protein